MEKVILRQALMQKLPTGFHSLPAKGALLCAYLAGDIPMD